MWSGFNVVGQRRRWASQVTDPGWSARAAGPALDYDPRTGRSAYTEPVKQAFLAREVVIDCPHPDCRGLLVTRQRGFGEAGGTASQVVLRCTREPEEHEFDLAIEPYGIEERERLSEAHQAGESPECARCGTALEPGTVEIPDDWTDAVSHEEGYRCPWCGLKWPLPSRLRRQEVGQAGIGDRA